MRALGPHHPTTIAARNALAACCRNTGRVQEALRLSGETQRLARTAVGPYDVATLAARNGQAAAHAMLGESALAEKLFRALLADCRYLLGADELITQAVRQSLAECCHHRHEDERAG